MVAIRFDKYHGAGNDYLLVDASDDRTLLDRGGSLAHAMSDRHFGVGADGLIAVERRGHGLRMNMWNADGSRGAICGNGLRCAARFAHDRQLIARDLFPIASDAAEHAVEVIRSHGAEIDRVRVDIGRATVSELDESIDIDGVTWPFVFGSVGNPHAVVFVDRDLATLDVERIGTAFQSSTRFSDGVNVEFVRKIGARVLEQRTFERGSGETLACGSGATVVVAAAIDRGLVEPGPVTVRLRGGDLEIARRDDSGFDLTGPVQHVFSGSVTRPN